MPYSVWCNDRLVGESELDYIANTDDHKMGDFAASAFGEELIPILMAPRKAMMARASRAEILRAQARREEIPLQLRGPDGAVVPAAHIEITDSAWLLEIAETHVPDDGEFERIDSDPPPWIEDESDELDEFDVPDVELDSEAAPEDFPRYQLQVLFDVPLARSRG